MIKVFVERTITLVLSIYWLSEILVCTMVVGSTHHVALVVGDSGCHAPGGISLTFQIQQSSLPSGTISIIRTCKNLCSYFSF